MNPSQFNSSEVIFSISVFVLPFLLGSLHAKFAGSTNMASTLLSYYVFIGVGLQGLITGIVQIAKPDWVVDYVHWPFSHFLTELGMANVSYGIIGILSLWMGIGWRNAVAVGYSIFLFATFLRHIVDIIQNGFYSGNSGAFLLTDLFIPFILLLLLGLQNKPDNTI